jgi:hypothetical protein
LWPEWFNGEDKEKDEVKEEMKDLQDEFKDRVPKIDMSTEAAVIFQECDFGLCVIM